MRNAHVICTNTLGSRGKRGRKGMCTSNVLENKLYSYIHDDIAQVVIKLEKFLIQNLTRRLLRRSLRLLRRK